MVRNIRGHRIRWSVLAAQGVIVGLMSALVMLAVAMITVPLLSEGTDAWSFPRIVGASLLGQENIDLQGFQVGVVSAGIATHLALSTVAGIAYAWIVGFFDLEGWTPVALMGLICGSVLFIWSAALIAAGFAPSPTRDLPLGALLLGHISFGLIAGLLLATWADRADVDQRASSRRTRVHAFEGDEIDTGLPR